MVQRVTYRRRLSYNTKSNKVRKVRTPGKYAIIKVLEWLSSTSPSEDMGQELPMIVAIAGRELTVLLSSVPTTTRVSPRRTRLSRDPMEEFFAGDASNQELLELFFLRRSRLLNVLSKPQRND